MRCGRDHTYMDSEPSVRDQTTDLLTTADSPGTASLDQLVPIIYEELRAIAHRQLRGGQRPASIQTTELVHEVYLKLVDDTRVTQRGRAYFYGTAAHAMRQVLVDAARKRNSAKLRVGSRRRCSSARLERRCVKVAAGCLRSRRNFDEPSQGEPRVQAVAIRSALRCTSG